MPRIPLPGPDEMNDEQRRLYDSVVSGPRGRMIGPLRAIIHSPELAKLWSNFGEFLRYRTCLPPAHKELAIIVTARRWTSQVEWWVHAKSAAKAGIADTIIAAILKGITPEFADHAEHDIYEFSRQLQMQGKVDQEVYERVLALHGTQGVVELTAVIGYYTMVSMTLNAHEIPLPEGEALAIAPLVVDGLTDLPKARQR